MAIPSNFAAFILTHGRPNRVLTYHTLRRCGYTGKIYLIVDNEDKTLDQYRAKYGDEVIVFDKAEIAKTTDTADLIPERNTVLFARNASFQIARDLGLEYFVQLDDDYRSFDYRLNHYLQYTDKLITRLDDVWSALLEFYQSSTILTLAMGQSGDYLGGAEGAEVKRQFKRKAMNSFFCSVNHPFQFIGRMNDDVNTYTHLGNQGCVFFTIYQTALKQTPTQENSGGLTEMYLKFGTYVKSFYTVIFNPSCVIVYPMDSNHTRLHHRISWDNAVPCIVPEKYRKTS